MTKMNLHEYIVSWTIDFERHRDIIQKDIQSIDKDTKECDLIISYKDKKRYIMAKASLDNIETLNKFATEKKSLTFITINSQENITFLIDNWKKLIQSMDFTIIFINPFSESEKRWMIKPYIHNMITEKESLQTGIKAMASTVDFITEKEMLGLINS